MLFRSKKNGPDQPLPAFTDSRLNSDPVLDKPLINLSNAKNKSDWTVRDAVEGVQIFGGIGFCKTSRSGTMIALKHLSNSFGGLVITAKHDEKHFWQEYCKLTNRTDDLIIVEPRGPKYFNFLEYESRLSQDSKSLTLNVVRVLKIVIRASQTEHSDKNDDRFWETERENLIANN